MSSDVSGIRAVPTKICHFGATVGHAVIAPPAWLCGRAVKLISYCAHGVGSGYKAVASGVNSVFQWLFTCLLSLTGCNVKKLIADKTSAEQRATASQGSLDGVTKERDGLTAKLAEIKTAIDKGAKRPDLLKLFPESQPQPAAPAQPS